jgi:hypothetical protein
MQVGLNIHINKKIIKILFGNDYVYLYIYRGFLEIFWIKKY